MVIKTPKLCDDVAFLSPQVDDPNYITCAPVLGADEDPSHLPHSNDKPAQLSNPFVSTPLPRVGTWPVGAHSLIPADRPLARSGILRGTTKARNGAAKAVLSSDGAVHDKAALNAAGVTSEAQLAQLREKMEARAKGQPWRLELEDGGVLKGLVGEDDEQDKVDVADKKAKKDEPKKDEQSPEGSGEEYFASDPEPAAAEPKKEKKKQSKEDDDEDKRIKDLGRELVAALMRREQVEGEPLLFWDDGAGEIAIDPELLEGMLNALPRHDEL